MGSFSCRGASVIALLTLSISTITRLALLAVARDVVTWDISVAGALASGFCFDVVVAIFATAAWWIIVLAAPPSSQPRGQRRFLGIAIFLYAAAIGFIAVAEWFFWDEFQARFNFIAVDYLIWTQEVWGNIGESYPMPWIVAGLVVFSVAVWWGLQAAGVIRWAVAGRDGWKARFTASVTAFVFIVPIGVIVKQSWLPTFANQYHSELAKNGMFSFGAAFWAMEIDYDRFYRTLPEAEAIARIRALLDTPAAPIQTGAACPVTRRIAREGPELKWNVLLVCMESLSADFMDRFGKKKHLTPNLNRLADEGLVFSKLYATGTRTVRGMEALTLSLPPTPGQAILYRPRSEGLRTIGTLFAERGYECSFIYGGNGRFDYMNRYFGSTGYEVLDKPAWQPGDVTFETSWGACDEDAFRVAIKRADRAHAEGKPFHHFIMTTSNHRPFQFPEGRIARASDTGRAGAVMYSDYAVGRLVAEASNHPWFDHTIFVFVADHCASSAGKEELDCSRYHIPAIVWNPLLIKPRAYDELCSQIDLMPTIFGLLNWSYESLFYGHDVLAAGPQPDKIHRAFISNYQKIALLTPQSLVILKPPRECSHYDVKLKTGELHPNPGLPSLESDAIGYYQTASWLFRSGALKAASFQTQ